MTPEADAHAPFGILIEKRLRGEESPAERADLETDSDSPARV